VLTGLSKFFHHRLKQLFGVNEFLIDQPQIHDWDGWISLAGAVDAVLADQYQSVGDAIEGNGKAAAVAPEALLEMLEFLLVFLKCGIHLPPLLFIRLRQTRLEALKSLRVEP